MSEPLVLFERDGAIVTLTLNRADKRNALKLALWGALAGHSATIARTREIPRPQGDDLLEASEHRWLDDIRRMVATGSQPPHPDQNFPFEVKFSIMSGLFATHKRAASILELLDEPRK